MPNKYILFPQRLCLEYDYDSDSHFRVYLISNILVHRAENLITMECYYCLLLLPDGRGRCLAGTHVFLLQAKEVEVFHSRVETTSESFLKMFTCGQTKRSNGHALGSECQHAKARSS